MELQTKAVAPNKKIRVLVVDDSPLMRKIITQILSQQMDMEVIATAAEGEEALRKAHSLQPDVITLDVEMPRMNGLEFLEALMPATPMRVVMLSSLTTEGAETTFACLQRGAIDFAVKPSKVSIDLKLADISEEIVRKIRLASVARLPRISSAKRVEKTESASPVVARRERVGLGEGVVEPKMVVVLASSTGGPNALHELLPLLPPNLAIAYLLVQHLPAGFSRLFATRLNSVCALTVKEAVEGERPQVGTVLVAGGGRHIVLNSTGYLAFSDDPPLWGVCPAADVLMPTVAHFYKDSTVGVVLTGMGRDGTLGVKAIHAKGGYCIAQNEETCVVYGMPKAAFETGCIDKVRPLKELASELIRLYEERERQRPPLLQSRLQRAG